MWSLKIFITPFLITWSPKFLSSSLFFTMWPSKNIFPVISSSNHEVTRTFSVTPPNHLVTKTFHHLLSHFIWSSKLFSSPHLHTLLQKTTFSSPSHQSYANYQLDSSILLCSASQNLHSPLTTYCLLFSKLPKTLDTHSP